MTVLYQIGKTYWPCAVCPTTTGGQTFSNSARKALKSTVTWFKPIKGSVPHIPIHVPSLSLRRTWWMPLQASLFHFVLHLREVSTAFQAFKQHPHWLHESVYRRLFLIDLPMDTSCPPSEAVFLFLIPTARSHDQSSPWRVVRIPVAAFAQPAGQSAVCVCVSVCVRACVRGSEVKGKRRPVDHNGLKGKVIITEVNYGWSSMSCILLCLHAPAPWPCFVNR